MPPTTSAEKQKKYRDKLKKENPQKYEEIQKKAKERSARYYEKKRVPILKSTNKSYGINGRKIGKKQKLQKWHHKMNREIRSNKIETDKRKIDQNRENKNDTKEEIKKNLKEKFLIEEKHKIEIECTKKDESKEILIVIAEEERKEADENKENYTIETEYKKQLESMRGQNNIGEVLQDADKYKQMEKTDLDKINKSENLKEDESDKESNTKEEGEKAIESEENTQNFILNINLLCYVDSIIVRYFQRKTWKYFIGFVENIEFKNGENYYKVKFLKTVKDLSDSVNL
ncbi:unnamed protein product [Parnassius apollo]|uniref:(apollo) hypothetical protein n=1 Tax=Parnassius apollo TaxID=110799 RepID=A0A8S3WI20_PARAO|nr:unnamed protein product [Parnassius apollo]